VSPTPIASTTAATIVIAEAIAVLDRLTLADLDSADPETVRRPITPARAALIATSEGSPRTAP
jgi:hypothetical protein